MRKDFYSLKTFKTNKKSMTQNKTQQNSYKFLLITLGMLSAFAPLVTDMYLPCLPTLKAYFNTSSSLAQMSLTMSMFGLAIGQIIVGPISDKYGRRRLLIFSLIAYIMATILCVLSPNIHTFNLMRLLQGMAASGGIVLSRSISTDLYQGPRLTEFLAMIAAINGIAPVFAPVIGGVLLSITSWKGIFIVLIFIGLVLLTLCLKIKESLSKEKRSIKPLLSTFIIYGKVFTNKTYNIHLCIYMFSMLILFAYVSSSPFILQSVYGLSPMLFSLCFALNAISIGVGCMLAGKMKGKQSLKAGGIVMIVSAIITALALVLVHNVIVVEIAFILIMFSFGLLQPKSTSIALDSERSNAGTASAALGASGFIMGGVVSPLVGIGNILSTTAIIIVFGAILTCSFILISLKERQEN